MTRHQLLAALVILGLLAVTSSFAAVPQLISYQGRLTDGVGNPLNSTEALTFTIYGDSLGVGTLWTEAHPSIVVSNGLFQVILGSVTTLPQSVFDGNTRWLSVRVGAGASSALMPLVSTAYAYRSNVTDTAAVAKTVSDNAITSAKIQNGTISFADIGQNSATNGEVIKWNGSAWEAQADATSANTSGWTDGGTVVNLTTATDTVAINTALRLGKLNVGGNVGLTGTSNIYFGNDSTRITGISGGDLRLVCEDLSMLTREDITFGRINDETWIKFDNANKRVGVGTTSVDERLHVENSTSGGTCWLKMQGSHATNWGQTGMKVQTPQNTWSLRMDLYSNANFPDGALSLYSSGGAIEAMTWLESGNVGVGTTSPTKKLHVYGSAMVKDTLYAGAINPPLMASSRLPDEPGVAVGAGTGGLYLGTAIAVGHTAFDSASITVPGPGYVFACETVTLESEHSGYDNTFVSLGLSTSATSTGSCTQIFSLDGGVPNGDYRIPSTFSEVFTVTTAGSRKYYAVGFRSSGTDVVNALQSTLTLIYIPTAYGDTKSLPSAAGGDMSASVKALTDAKSRAGILKSQQTDLISELRALREEVETLKKRLDEQKK